MHISALDALPAEAVSHNGAIAKQVIVRSGQIDNLVYFSRACFGPGEVAGAHHHSDMSEVFFVESGQGAIAINGKSHDLHPGTCIAVEPGETHEITNNTDSEDLILLYFGILSPS
ncbi:MAG: cupin domain-containing protein [Elainellaceae cyanobacterium]